MNEMNRIEGSRPKPSDGLRVWVVWGAGWGLGRCKVLRQEEVGMKGKKRWESYEEVSAFLLNDIVREFGLSRVEGKQKVPGLQSGTTYTIDAKAVAEDESIFFIVECRRYTKSRQNQDKVGGLAYRIIDSGASGGIMVSPLGLQEGAALVASAANIHSVLLDENSTRTEYILRFLNQVRVGLEDRVSAVEQVEILVNCACCNAGGKVPAISGGRFLSPPSL